MINDLLGKNRKNNSTYFINREETYTDNFEIAEGFNDYFCGVAENLARHIEEPRIQFQRYLPPSVPFSFYLRPSSCAEIIKS